MHGGGAERVIALLSSRLSRNNSVSIITLLSSEKSVYPVDEKVKFYSLPNYGNRIKMLLRIPSDLNQLMKKLDSDVYISFCTMENVFSLLANHKLNRRLVICERNSPSTEKINIIFKLLRKRLYKEAECIVCQTTDAKMYYQNKYGLDGFVIPNPVSDSLPIGTQKKRNHICAVGRLSKQKNYPFLIECFSLFHRTHPDYVLDIYGTGELEKSIKKKISEKKLGNSIILHGFVKNVHELIKDAGMYVLSSDYEGMPNALLEALAIGLPCISTDCPIGGPKELIENNENGILVKTGNIKEMVSAMTLIADDREKAYKFAENAKKIREKYCLENIVRNWKEILNI